MQKPMPALGTSLRGSRADRSSGTLKSTYWTQRAGPSTAATATSQQAPSSPKSNRVLKKLNSTTSGKRAKRDNRFTIENGVSRIPK